MRIPAFLLDQWLNEYQFGVAPPQFNFAASTGPRWTAREIFGLTSADERESLLETKLYYSNAAGGERLRQAIAEMHGTSAEHVQVVTGAAEALLILFFLASEPGANVILPFPLFPPTATVANLLGLETRFYYLRPENDYSIDLEEIKKLADDRTKLLLVNTPHNPTGATLSDEELRELHDFAVERGIRFVCDEVFHPVYHGRETSSASVLEQATAVGSFSKTLSLSGLRLGWLIDHDEARLRQYENARSYFTISNTVLGEGLGVIALKHRDKIFDRTRRVTSTNLALLDGFFAEHADELGWVRPRGGTMAFAWLKNESDARPFCRELAERGVLLVPGDCFQMPEHFRLGFGVTEEGFAEGLELFADYLRSRARAATLTAA